MYIHPCRNFFFSAIFSLFKCCSPTPYLLQNIGNTAHLQSTLSVCYLNITFQNFISLLAYSFFNLLDLILPFKFFPSTPFTQETRFFWKTCIEYHAQCELRNASSFSGSNKKEWFSCAPRHQQAPHGSVSETDHVPEQRISIDNCGRNEVQAKRTFIVYEAINDCKIPKS